MASIPSTTFKDWKDGDIVVASEYERELEIIRAAVNNNHDNITVLQSAAGGSISRIPSGTVFPTSNIQTGQVFFRTDQELLYILDAGSQWEAFSPKVVTDAHANNKENPHTVTATQVGAVPILPSGIVNMPSQSAVIVNSVGGQNQASDATIKLSILTSKELDRQSEWSTINSRFTAKETGVYFVRAFVDWGSTVPTSSSVIYVYKNGSNYSLALNVAGANIRYNIGSCLVPLSQNDTLEFYTLQSSGGTQKTLATARIEIAKLM